MTYDDWLATPIDYGWDEDDNYCPHGILFDTHCKECEENGADRNIKLYVQLPNPPDLTYCGDSVICVMGSHATMDKNKGWLIHDIAINDITHEIGPHCPVPQ